MLDGTQRTTAADLPWAAERDLAPGYRHLLDTLPSVSCTAADVLAATDYIVPSLELIDSRIRDGRIELAGAIADNASSAGVILGEARRTPAELTARGIDLADIDVVLYVTASFE